MEKSSKSEGKVKYDEQYGQVVKALALSVRNS